MVRKVRYIGYGSDPMHKNWGNYSDPDLLTVGRVYTLEREEIHSYHTEFYLVEFPGERFNSTMFREA